MPNRRLLQLLALIALSRGRAGRGHSYGRRPRKKSNWGVVALLIIGAWLAYQGYKHKQRAESSRPRVEQTEASTSVDVERGDGGIGDLFRTRTSGVMVQGSGQVSRVLSDDTEVGDGTSRHQRFILKFPDGRTVLVAHNIDLAKRIPIKAGDEVTFRGDYQWNEQGGVVHWTHHDPKRQREGGWIEHAGQRYE